MSKTLGLSIAAVYLTFAALGIAQPNSATLREPTVFGVLDLYRHADIVAVVKVISGDTEAYETPVYKGQVVTAFKGVSADDIIYFGSYLGTQLGYEYVLFLQNIPTRLQPKKAGGAYGVVKYSKVFNEGYSSMLTSYECVFNGASPAQACDYAVRICTDYIKPPKSLPTSPASDVETPFGCRWARRDQFISILNEIARPNP
jgi:hypothetical protein